LKGKKDLVAKLKQDSLLSANQKAADGLNELDLLFDFLEAFGISNLVQFDLSLARGLDYYTGLIMEAIMTDGEVGSIAGGGRYDNLVGMFSPKNQIPCVGFSIGIERIFSVLEARMAKDATRLRSTSIDVFVAASGDSLLLERMKLCNDLWAAGLNAEFSYKKKPKYLDQVSHCEKQKIPLMVILGPAELEKGCVLVKCGTDSQDRGTSVEVEQLVDNLKCRLKLQ
jgi:histidyl-tRNA synthetase